MIKAIKKLIKTFFITIFISLIVVAGSTAIYTYLAVTVDYSITQPVEAKVVRKYSDSSEKRTKYYIIVSINNVVEHTMQCNEMRFVNTSVNDKITIQRKTTVYKNNNSDTFYSFD